MAPDTHPFLAKIMSNVIAPRIGNCKNNKIKTYHVRVTHLRYGYFLDALKRALVRKVLAKSRRIAKKDLLLYKKFGRTFDSDAKQALGLRNVGLKWFVTNPAPKQMKSTAAIAATRHCTVVYAPRALVYLSANFNLVFCSVLQLARIVFAGHVAPNRPDTRNPSRTKPAVCLP